MYFKARKFDKPVKPRSRELVLAWEHMQIKFTRLTEKFDLTRRLF